jgi:hypothetical protein
MKLVSFNRVGCGFWKWNVAKKQLNEKNLPVLQGLHGEK